MIAFRVEGRVQGVAFRAFTCECARDLGLAGWVANVADGAVEGRVEGDPQALVRFFEELAQGPPGAWVKRVEQRVMASETPPLERPFRRGPNRWRSDFAQGGE